MRIEESIESVKQLVASARAAGKTVGFVPTMGALHRGHLSLIEAAAGRCDFVVVSIFVNPTQFGPSEDLDKYPKDIAADSKLCEDAGVDLIFAPAASEMYPDENVRWVTVEGLTENLCGRSRPDHFRGVTTVCAKLFDIVKSDIAFFGQKDAQQAVIIKRMVCDLNLPLEIEVCPTVREADGLALSSRNRYLTADERKDASLLYAGLKECEKCAFAGTTDAQKLISVMKSVINSSAAIKIDYIQIVDTETLRDIPAIAEKALVAVAARLGTTRLIDNLLIDLNNWPTDV